ncbi:MAG: OsmC family protein [Rhodospirillales bacterium]
MKWVQDRMFLGESGSGHTIVMDGAPNSGGRNMGVRPMETILIGMGGCTAFDVVHILEKSREAIEDCVADITAERAEDDPKVFTKIHVKFTVTGKKLNPEKVERAVHLTAEKYCSASIMLAKTAEITHEIKIIDTST